MIDRLLKSPPRAAVAFTSAAVLTLVAIADQATSREIVLAFFYVIPVGLAAWFLDRAWASGFAAAGAMVWLLLDVLGRPTVWDPVVTLWNAVSYLGVLVGAALVLVALKDARTRSEALTRSDDLTGARNAVGFYDAARSEIERARRAGTMLTAAYFDVDGLDEVEREHGRDTADRLLKTVADTIGDVVRSTDVVARLHDDEFAVLFPETGRVEAGAVLLKISERALEVTRDNAWDVGLRMGAATFARAPESVNEMRHILEDVLHTARTQDSGVVEHQLVG